MGGEGVDGRPAEEFEHRDSPFEALGKSGLDPDQEQRASPEIKEVVVDTDVGDSRTSCHTPAI